jgi:tagatose-1,6-bisphosphate aldolase
MMQIQMEHEARLRQTQTDEEKRGIAKELDEAATAITVRVLWTTVVVDITSALHEACNMVFYDQGVDQQTRHKRAVAVKAMGKVWMSLPNLTTMTRTIVIVMLLPSDCTKKLPLLPW